MYYLKIYIFSSNLVFHFCYFYASFNLQLFFFWIEKHWGSFGKTTGSGLKFEYVTKIILRTPIFEIIKLQILQNIVFLFSCFGILPGLYYFKFA